VHPQELDEADEALARLYRDPHSWRERHYGLMDRASSESRVPSAEPPVPSTEFRESSTESLGGVGPGKVAASAQDSELGTRNSGLRRGNSELRSRNSELRPRNSAP